MTLTPRFDLAYTGDSYGSIFNGNVNKIQGYAQVNAQVQLNGADDKWFVKGFIQNIFDANSVTGLYITDQSSGNYTNIFTLEPRRYGIAPGVRFLRSTVVNANHKPPASRIRVRGFSSPHGRQIGVSALRSLLFMCFSLSPPCFPAGWACPCLFLSSLLPGLSSTY